MTSDFKKWNLENQTLSTEQKQKHSFEHRDPFPGIISAPSRAKGIEPHLAKLGKLKK